MTRAVVLVVVLAIVLQMLAFCLLGDTILQSAGVVPADLFE